MTSGAAVERMIAGRDDPAGAIPSAAALAANARLEELRRAAGVVTRPALDQDQGAKSAASTARPSPADRGQAMLEARRRELGINYRPPVATVEGAAWSAWAADHVAAGLDQGQGGAGDVCAQTLDPSAGAGGLPLEAAASTLEDDPAGADLDQLAGVEVTVYPSLAAAFQATKHLAPVGRLWLLLRAWDTAGRGCYTLDQVHRVFSAEGSAWRVADRRQVQRLIKAGAGIFWTLRDHHGGRYHGLQMTGPAGVAAALGLDRLAGRPVAVPVADLLQGMHRVNAALYAAVVTLRRPRRRGAGRPRPVTRRTLAGMTGRAASTQRTYSKTARIEAQTNYVILPCGDVDAAGAFVMVDYLGLQGQAGRARLARQMPNSYVVPLAAASRGRQRKINRRLNLVITEARGYWPEVDYRRIYHDTATGAARAYGRNHHDDHYWPVGQTAAGACLWHMVEAVNL